MLLSTPHISLDTFVKVEEHTRKQRNPRPKGVHTNRRMQGLLPTSGDGKNSGPVWHARIRLGFGPKVGFENESPGTTKSSLCEPAMANTKGFRLAL